jgi:hypothetical protein
MKLRESVRFVVALFCFITSHGEVLAGKKALDESTKRNPRHCFTKKDDKKLISAVREYSISPQKNTYIWVYVAACVPGFNRKQCRNRWYNYLQPGLNRSKFSPEEDMFLIKMVQQYGKYWSFLMRYFPNRTYADLKNRWYVLNSRSSLHDNWLDIQADRSLPLEESFEEFEALNPFSLFDEW